MCQKHTHKKRRMHYGNGRKHYHVNCVSFVHWHSDPVAPTPPNSH